MSTIQAGVPVKTPRRRRSTRLRRKQTRVAWLMLAPALVVIGFVAFYTLGRTVYQSFTAEQFLGGTTHWIGLHNFKDLIHDAIFRDSVVVRMKFTVITEVYELVMGMIIALGV